MFDMPTGDGIIGGAMSLVGGILGNRSARKQAAAQMAFQERMRATQYQTAVEDLKLAGLNPMLAYTNGGAGTPAGAMAQQSDVVTPAVNTALSARRNKAEVANMENSNDLITQQTAKAKAEGNAATAAESAQRTQAAVNLELEKKVKAEADVASATASKIRQNTYMDTLAIPRMENQAAVERTSAAQAAAYIDRAKETMGGMSFPKSGKYGKYDKRTGEIFE